MNVIDSKRPGIPRHLIKTVFEMWKQGRTQNGMETTDDDELVFVCGIAASIGVITGSLDVGIRVGTDSRDVIVQLVEETDKYNTELKLHAERLAKRALEGKS